MPDGSTSLKTGRCCNCGSLITFIYYKPDCLWHSSELCNFVLCTIILQCTSLLATQSFASPKLSEKICFFNALFLLLLLVRAPSAPVLGSDSLPLQIARLNRVNLLDWSWPGWFLCLSNYLTTFGQLIHFLVVNSLIQNCGTVLPPICYRKTFHFKSW